MLKQVVKVGVIFVTAAVGIPYTMAFVCNILHGWPLGKHKFRRAFNPKKVYKLNYAILKKLTDLRYVKLYFRWKRFYSSAPSSRILKDITFGTNDCNMDVYIPHSQDGKPLTGHFPVVVFVYGGTWSSGDKNMYPLLCSQLADALKAVVCCPNYSIYPRGYVDDMVQDVVDCLKWIHGSINRFGGDKERIMLLGHSAGAHLATMAALELTMKQLMEDPNSLVVTGDDEVTPSMSVSRQGSGIHFDEVHFNNANGGGDQVALESSKSLGASGETTPPLLLSGASALTNPLESSGSSFMMVQPEKQHITLQRTLSDGSSILVLDDNGDKSRHLGKSVDSSLGKGDGLETLDQVSKTDSDNGGAPLRFEMEQSRESIEVIDEESNDQDRGENNKGSDEDVKIIVEGPSAAEDASVQYSSADKKALQLETAIEANSDAGESLGFEPLQTEGDVMTTSQMEERSILSAIRVIVGLAGVYHIGDHYDYEYSRGYEDTSCMTRAMYGPEHFDRLSPTVIVNSLPKNTRLPAFHLIYGSRDNTVPKESSMKFEAALNDMGSKHVYTTEIPECSHKDICLDIMDPERKFHSSVISQLYGSARRYLR